jgi:dTDP-4-amino-4,6-dideoxygalactose transaminase
VPEIATFGKLISAAAGHSSLREIVVNDVHPGGCAVNLADGLASRVLALPMHHDLSDDHMRIVGEALHKVAEAFRM